MFDVQFVRNILDHLKNNLKNDKDLKQIYDFTSENFKRLGIL